MSEAFLFRELMAAQSDRLDFGSSPLWCAKNKCMGGWKTFTGQGTHVLGSSKRISFGLPMRASKEEKDYSGVERW